MAVSFVALIAGLVGAVGFAQGLVYTYPPFITGRTRQTFRQTPNVLPAIDQLVSMAYRGELEATDFQKYARELGLKPEWAEKTYTVMGRLLEARDYVTAWRRGEIDEDKLDDNLTALHIVGDDIGLVKKVTEYFPPPPDLVRFAVREVYNATTREKFGLDEDITEEYLEAAKKAGLPEDQGRNYWAAHWELPSVGQAMEMLHRGVINEEELDLLLKAQDVMPFWRDALKKIAYSPLTRVDVRRMHAMGILGPDGLIKAYMDLGYDKENAEKMKDFTIAYNTKEEKGLTRSSVTKAYLDDIISESELSEFLEALGYEANVINLYLAQANKDKGDQRLAEKKAALALRYKFGAIDKATYARELGIVGVSSASIERELEKTDSERAETVKLPSRTDLENWLKDGIITEEYWTSQMRQLNYRDSDITNYLIEIIAEVEEKAVKDLPITTYQRFFRKGLISEQDFRDIAGGLGYSQDDTELLIAETGE